jgi:cyclopropane fatty-acyl-phospholipid synthase-like methyltransferase
MVDGTDLNKWEPKEPFDFIVSIEVIEHLEQPRRFLQVLDSSSKKGVVLTTPNPHVTDVKAMDATHISEVYPKDFYAEGYRVFPAILFFENGDSLIAIRDKRSMIGL